MKNLVIYFLIYLICFVSVNIYGQSGESKTSPLIRQLSDQTKLGLSQIGSKILGSKETQLNLTEMTHGHAGYYLRYDMMYLDVPVYKCVTTLILKDDLLLNDVISSNIDTKGLNNSNHINYSSSQAKTILNSNVSNTETALYRGKYWIKLESNWVIGYRYMASNNDTDGYSFYWIDAESGVIYIEKGKEFRKATLSHDNTSILNVNSLEEIKKEENHLSEVLIRPHQDIFARIFKRYPMVGEEDVIVTDDIDNKGNLAGDSPLKYSENGVNDLKPNSSDNFIYSHVNQKENYSKAYAWIRMKQLFGTEFPVRMNVLYGNNNLVGFDKFDLIIKFGGSVGFYRPYAMDEFWIAFAGEDYLNQTKFVNGSDAVGAPPYSGYIDYLAQVRLNKLGIDSVCNYWGGITPGVKSLTTASQIPCLIENAPLATQTRNAISTLLAQIHLDETNLGEEVVEKIMTDIFASNPSVFKEDNPYDFIKYMWQTAKLLHKNNSLSISQLCSFKAKINSYFASCTESNVFRVTDNLIDLYISDDVNDTGNQPNQSNSPEWLSPSILNRQSPDASFMNENVISNTENTLYIEIKNTGCDSLADATLMVYYSLSETGLAWDESWIEKIIRVGNNEVLGGTKIAEVKLPAIGTQALRIPITWTPPDLNALNLNSTKINILARIISPVDLMYKTEVIDIRSNVRENNNIAWKVLNLTK